MVVLGTWSPRVFDDITSRSPKPDQILLPSLTKLVENFLMVRDHH